MIIILPWPSRRLHPNARQHWRSKVSVTKAARQTAGWLAKKAGVKRIDADSLDVTVTFVPPDHRRRDTDGMLSAAKASLDGIADVIGVDDSRWNLSIKREEPCPPGAVRVEIGGIRP